jgi:hypothetical protein
MTNDEILDLLRKEEEAAENSLLNARRQKIYDYYDGDLSQDVVAEEGRSSVTSMDVLELVEALLPNIIRRFASASELVRLRSVGPEDEVAAKQETDVINHIFWEEMDGFTLLYRWIKAALMDINSTVKTFMDEREMSEPVLYKGLTEDQLAIILNDPEIQLTGYQQHETQLVDQFGTVTPIVIFDVEGRRNWKERKVCAELLLPEEFLVSSDAKHLNDTEARFRCHRARKTVSKLIQMGFPRDVAEQLPSPDEDYSLTRSEDEDFSHLLGMEAADKSQEVKECVEAVALLDINDDGISERIRAIYAGDHLLENEEYACRYGPFHTITPIMMPHSNVGKSPAELVLDIARIKTALQRGILDNIYATNKPRELVVWGQLTQEGKDDIYDSGIGTKIRATNIDAIRPLTVPFVAAESFPVINYWDSVKKDRTGVGAELLGVEASQLSQINTGVMQDAIETVQTKVDLIARVISESGIRSLFLGIHELLRKYQDVPLRIKLRNEWVEVDPRGWRDRTNLTVQVGLGAFNRTSNSLALQQIIALQKELLMGGPLAVMVTPQNLYNSLVEVVRNSGLRSPELYFTEPPPAEEMPQEEPQQDPQIEASLQIAQLQMQIEQMKIEAAKEKDRQSAEIAVAKTKAEFEAKELEASLSEMKIRVDDENEDLDRVLKKQEIENRFEIERAKLRLQASIDQKDRDAVPPPSNDGAIDSLMEQNKKIEEQLAALQKEHARSTAEAKVAAEKQSIKDGRLAEFEATLKQKSKTEEDVQKALAFFNDLKTRLKEEKKPEQITAKELAKLYKEFEKELGL